VIAGEIRITAGEFRITGKFALPGNSHYQVGSPREIRITGISVRILCAVNRSNNTNIDENGYKGTVLMK